MTYHLQIEILSMYVKKYKINNIPFFSFDQALWWKALYVESFYML